MQATVIKGFTDIFGATPRVVTRAPGRLEILGNHTDYNEGVVLSAAVDRVTCVAMSPCTGTSCRVIDAVRNEERLFDLTQLDRPEAGDWANYIKGLIVQFQERDISVPAFEAVFGSSIPIAAGMSSSAALEMSMAIALAELACARLPWQDIARIGQACENAYVGANTGLLDQFSSLRGKADHLVFSDFRTLDVTTVPIPEEAALVVANSMVKHTLTNEYNERRQACEQAVEILAGANPDIRALRDVTPEDLEAVEDRLPPTVFKRARHVVGENARVLAGVNALADGNLESFGRLMFESHESSRIHFQNSCDELDHLVDIARGLPGALGARLSGGGFGGISVHLVRQPYAQDYTDRLQTEYATKTGLKADVMICRAADGAGKLSP